MAQCRTGFALGGRRPRGLGLPAHAGSCMFIETIYVTNPST